MDLSRELQLTESNVARFLRGRGLASYDELVRRSIDDIEWFWDSVVRDLPIDFFRPYERVLDDSGGIAWAKWFVGGTINLAWNCLDRHVLTFSGRDRTALVWEGESGDSRTWTYGRLADETNRAANAFRRLGIGPGDRVGLFLPMRPEAVAAFLAWRQDRGGLDPDFLRLRGRGGRLAAGRRRAARLLVSAASTTRKGKAAADAPDRRRGGRPCQGRRWNTWSSSGTKSEAARSPRIHGASTAGPTSSPPRRPIARAWRSTPSTP